MPGDPHLRLRARSERLRAAIDRRLFRHVFCGTSASGYQRDERPAFADLDSRLLRAWHERLSRANTMIDLGAGPATFALAAKAQHPHLRVIAAEPSPDYALLERGPRAPLYVRCTGEALPIADTAVDVMVCLSSIRHVASRSRVLAELRRVSTRQGRLYIVELDPTASVRTSLAHSRRLRSWPARLLFDPWVLRLSPGWKHIADIALVAGWRLRSLRRDEQQPVYIAEFGLS